MEYIIKACGIIMVIFATTAYGMVLCADLKKRLSELKEIKKRVEGLNLALAEGFEERYLKYLNF